VAVRRARASEADRRPVVPARTAPPDARTPGEREPGFAGSDLMAIETSGLAAALGLYTDWRFEHSYRSF
jgi:hypothetical protein